jgi:CRP/FNR family transcriptional regulator
MGERVGRTVQADGNGTLRFDLPLSRQDIADLLGLTIETVSRQITHLRERGIIETPGRRGIVVLDGESLGDCAEEA